MKKRKKKDHNKEELCPSGVSWPLNKWWSRITKAFWSFTEFLSIASIKLDDVGTDKIEPEPEVVSERMDKLSFGLLNHFLVISSYL